MNLLEKAKASKSKWIPARTIPLEETLPLAMAYLSGELSIAQIGDALGINRGAAYARMAAVLLASAREGLVTITVNERP